MLFSMVMNKGSLYVPQPKVLPRTAASPLLPPIAVGCLQLWAPAGAQSTQSILIESTPRARCAACRRPPVYGAVTARCHFASSESTKNRRPPTTALQTTCKRRYYQRTRSPKARSMYVVFRIEAYRLCPQPPHRAWSFFLRRSFLPRLRRTSCG